MAEKRTNSTKTTKTDKPVKERKPRQPKKAKITNRAIPVEPSVEAEQRVIDFNQIEQLAALALKEETPMEQRVIMALTVCANIPMIGQLLRTLVNNNE